MTKRPVRRQQTRRGRRTRVVVVGALALTLTGAGGLAVALSRSGDGAAPLATSIAPPVSATAGPADQWRARATASFADLASGLVEFLRAVDDWRSGKTGDDAVTATTRRVLPMFVATRDKLAGLEPFAAAPRALEDYQAAAGLYSETAGLVDGLTSIPPGPLREQAVRTLYRIRIVADRVYDQAAVELSGGRQTAQDPTIAYVRGAEIPDMRASGYAAGPPLTDTATAGPTPTPRAYQETRPERDFADWASVVRAGLPDAADQASTLKTGSTAERAAMAERLGALADALQAGADPRGERALNTRVALGLLVQAEALRVAQLAGLGPERSREQVLAAAMTTAQLGARLWDERLGERHLGVGEAPAA